MAFTSSLPEGYPLAVRSLSSTSNTVRVLLCLALAAMQLSSVHAHVDLDDHEETHSHAHHFELDADPHGFWDGVSAEDSSQHLDISNAAIPSRDRSVAPDVDDIEICAAIAREPPAGLAPEQRSHVLRPPDFAQLASSDHFFWPPLRGPPVFSVT